MIDNGSDITEPSKYSNVNIEKNCQTTNGWLKGLEACDKSGEDYLAYMFLITSTAFVTEQDIVSKLAKSFEDKDVVGVHPSLTQTSTTDWVHLKCRDTEDVRETWMIDNICSMYRADWFNSIGRFDKDMIYAHGIDLEVGLLARRQNKKLLVDDSVKVEKITDIGYTMNRMNMSAKTRRENGYSNMVMVLRNKYGERWEDIIMNEGVTPEML